MNKKDNSSYMFIGDISLDHDQDVEGVLEYPTMSGMTEENVFRLCTDVLVNSSVAKKCGRFFDRDIMHAIDMCVVDVTLMDDPSWAVFSLPLIEIQCEASIWRQSNKWRLKSGTKPPQEIIDVLNCPNLCSGHGICNGKKCLCQPGWTGPSCSYGTGVSEPTLKTIPNSQVQQLGPKVMIVGINYLCDLRASDINCTSIDVYGERFPIAGALCHLENLSTQEFQTSHYSYVSSNHVRCMVPNNWLDHVNFLQHELTLKISIGNEIGTDLPMVGGVQFVIYDSDCKICEEKRNSHGIQECRKRFGVCSSNGRCFKEGEKNPHDKCSICKLGNWINEKRHTKPTVTSALNMKFTVLIGDTFAYRLPTINPETRFELISAPFGSTLDPERGLLRWKAISNLVMDKWTEAFVVKAVGGCGEQTFLEVSLDVLRCHCQNGGHCRTDMSTRDGSPVCQCPKGFTGESCEISDACSPGKCNHGSCIPGSENSFLCLCHPGFTGKLCDTEIKDGCKSNPCYAGVDCVTDPSGKFRCGICPSGFTGNGLSCHLVVDPCESNPCFPDVLCTRISNDTFECGPCPEHMTGDGIQCEEIDACTSKKPCYSGVECFPLGQEDFVCGPCPFGKTGDGRKCVTVTSNVTNDRHNICKSSNPCFDKSMCRMSNGNVTCVACPKGYKGDGVTCSPVNNFEDLCSEKKNPCFPGSRCDVVNGIVTCGPCPEGSTGDGKVCHPHQHSSHPKSTRIDFCQSNPCYPGTECYNLSDRFKCGSCPSGFTGNGIKCTHSRNPCKPNPCYPGVSCITVWKGRHAQFACGLCPDGMVGDGVKCTRTDPCESSPCFLGSVCLPLHDQGSYECGPCPDGLIGTGKVCRSPFNPCESNPCYPGVACGEKDDSFECGPCPAGTIGDGIMCKDIDDCRNDLCFPGVKCEDLKAPMRGYRCGPCPTGFVGNGKHCLEQVSHPVPCPTSSRCFPGVECFLTNSSSSLTSEFITCGPCPDGYSGSDGIRCKPKCLPKCDSTSQTCTAPDTCTTLCDPPCENGGRCTKSGRCKCPPGLKGAQCNASNSKKPRDEKMISTFHNNNNNFNNNSHNNDNLLCPTEPCLNGGTCLVDSGICSCKIGTRGRFCQEINDYIDALLEPSVGFLLTKWMDEGSNPTLDLVPRCKRRCQNGGSCINGKNRCKCPPGYRGRFCQKPKCNGGCRNGGKCVAPETCICQPGFSGKNCKTVSAICNPQCQNGGKCLSPGKCRCKSMFTGNFCQQPKMIRRRSAIKKSTRIVDEN